MEMQPRVETKGRIAPPHRPRKPFKIFEHQCSHVEGQWGALPRHAGSENKENLLENSENQWKCSHEAWHWIALPRHTGPINHENV